MAGSGINRPFLFFAPGPASGRKDRWYKCASQPARQAEMKKPCRVAAGLVKIIHLK